ncbi:AsmA-like C-terminal region-containing protein [Eudoraea chungangensis]|uniref:AsmA-like C-terminal region-containing protein n=1 Tax=Eudoraea chungangensis TaxID=1481905 RepID=UPI0023EAF22C|nr:AsmA-like C-terminal region-containing protein [Eudoraea chungangensis]
MKKKLLKITAFVLLLFLGILVVAPFFLEAKIGDLIKTNVNNSIHGSLDFKEADLSLIRSFPNAELTLNHVILLSEKGIFKGDTLFKSKSISLKMGLMELFNGGGSTIGITNLTLDRAVLSLKTERNAETNFDIVKKEESHAPRQNTGGMTFSLETYELLDSEVNYQDYSSGLFFQLSELNHGGAGDLSLDKSELSTKSTALISFTASNVHYLNKTKLQLEAILGIDLKTNTYSILENTGYLNKLPLNFNGFVKNLDKGQQVSLKFSTPTSDFDNFLAIFPERYLQDIEEVKTTGKFSLKGEVDGIFDENHIPSFILQMSAKDASLHYPNLPNSISDINLKLEIKNQSGLTEETSIDLEKASFAIDQDRFELTANLTDLLGNTRVLGQLLCNVDLENISKAYPLPDGQDLKGILNANIAASFDMASLKKEEYENTALDGFIKVKDLKYKSTYFNKSLTVSKALMNLSSSKVSLNSMKGGLGNTDFTVDGTIYNFLGYMFNEEEVKGSFKLSSDTFDIGDFVTKSDAKAAEAKKKSAEPMTSLTEERIQVPAFLNCIVEAEANKLIYDNLILKNVSGKLKIADEKVELLDVQSNLYEGVVKLNGFANTKGDASVFSMKLHMKNLNLEDSFKKMEFFRVLAPMAKALEGKLNSEIEVSGALKEDFTPDLGTISGNMLSELYALKINPKDAKILNALNARLSFIEVEEFDLQTLKTVFSFENGRVTVKPFTLNYRDIGMTVEGSHTFDQKLNYKMQMEVPTKYLGREVNSLMSSIGDKELENFRLPVNATVGGTYKELQVDTDLSSSIKELSSRLVEVQKQKLIKKGSEKTGKLLADVLKDKNRGEDSLNSTESKTLELTDALEGVLSNSKKEKDSTSNIGKDDAQPGLSKKAKGLLGNILGAPKEKSNSSDTNKDSTN